MQSVFDRLGIQEEMIPKHSFSVHAVTGQFVTTVHHHSRYQLLYAEHGVLRFLSDDKQFILPTNHGAWIPAGLIHKVVSSSANLHFRTLYLGYQKPEYHFPDTLTIFPISLLAREMIVYTQQWHYDDPITQAEEAFYDAISYLIADWCRDAIRLILPTTEHKHLLPITAFMLAHLDKPLTLTQVGNQFGMSSRTLMRLFRQEMDTTFQAYLRVARIIKALELLSTTDMTITEVSLQVGYQSMSSFSATFKAFVGQSPTQFRQHHRQ